jgi:hypothetical protein
MPPSLVSDVDIGFSECRPYQEKQKTGIHADLQWVGGNQPIRGSDGNADTANREYDVAKAHQERGFMAGLIEHADAVECEAKTNNAIQDGQL